MFFEGKLNLFGRNKLYVTTIFLLIIMPDKYTTNIY